MRRRGNFGCFMALERVVISPKAREKCAVSEFILKLSLYDTFFGVEFLINRENFIQASFAVQTNFKRERGMETAAPPPSFLAGTMVFVDVEQKSMPIRFQLHDGTARYAI